MLSQIWQMIEQIGQAIGQAVSIFVSFGSGALSAVDILISGAGDITGTLLPAIGAAMPAIGAVSLILLGVAGIIALAVWEAIN